MSLGLLGAHVSSAGKLSKAFERAAQVGADCLQIFTRAPSQWAARPLQEPEAFREAHRLAGSPPVFAHDLYLTNLAAEDPLIRERSIESQIVEMQRCAELGVQGLVCHMGSHPEEHSGLRLLDEAIGRILSESPENVQMLLETCAGQGNCLGHRFEHLAYLLERYPALGVCVDTCHMLAAGYDLVSEEGYERTWERFRELVGFERLKLLHLNDSQKPCGSRVDRHANIGKGAIGEEAFRRLLTDPRFEFIPGLIETPDSEKMHKKDLNLLRRLSGRKRPRKASRAPRGKRAR